MKAFSTSLARPAAVLALMAGSVLVATAAQPLNALTAEEKAAGWKLLFDGQSLQGWRLYNKKAPPGSGWRVEQGILKKLANQKGGDLITDDEFDDFDLTWEWRIAPAGNNGVKYLVTEQRPSAPGHEYQMIDDDENPDGKFGPKRQTASFYDVLPPQVPARSKPPGEWNRSRLLIQGNHIEHWLNGEKVLAFELGSPEVKAALAKSKFKDAPGYGDKIKGQILLTNHHDEAWYRNIRIRELPAR
jgi:hypothetical protein